MPGGPTPAAPRAADLGLPVLGGLVDGTRAAVVVLRPDRRVVYVNPSGCVLLGRSLAALRGRDLLERVPADEHPALLRHLDPVYDGATFACIVRGGDDAEREVVGSAVAVRSGDEPLHVLTLWDQTGPRSASRTGAALVQTAAQVGTTDIDLVLTEIARHVVEGTRASKCGIAVAGEDDRLSAGGAFCAELSPGALYQRATGSAFPGVSPRPAAEWISAITGGAVLLGSAPSQPVLLADARSDWAAHPVTRGYAASIAALPYRAALAIPLSWQDEVIGLCTLHLPDEVVMITESELAFATALADQAALAVVNARLTEHAGEVAALRERARLARELHDSVIQSLFSMTLHARAAQLAIENDGGEPDATVARSLHEVSLLVKDALAEMRALIFELRPDGLAEEGLVAALRHQAAALSAREAVRVLVEGPTERLVLDAEVEQQLYRIAVEALNNVVKHAKATRVVVRLVPEAGAVRLVVVDDGVGFEVATPQEGHLGLSTMAERAASIGARIDVRSERTTGTSITVAVPTSPTTEGSRGEPDHEPGEIPR